MGNMLPFKHGGLPMSRWICAQIALILIASTATAAPRVKAKPTAATFFPTAVGTTWVYRDGDRRTTEVILAVEDTDDGRRLTVGWLQGWNTFSTFELLVTRRELFLVRTGNLTWTPPLSLLRTDVRAGETWGPAADESALTDGINRVGEREEVEVPAGRFEATPVRTASRGFLGGNTVEPTMWYSPGVGLVKADYGRTTRVLIAFYPGRSS
jgi:hypothetical protein